jgi:hypothetical protein
LSKRARKALGRRIDYGQDLEESMVRAVNDTKDNLGAAVGALHGKKAIPVRWVRNLSGRTTDRDDGKVFEILARAREVWDRPTDHAGPSSER